MEFRSYEIAYRVRGGRRAFSHEGLGPYSCEDLDLRVSFDGESLRLEVVPRVPLRVERCRVTLAHRFSHGERYLLNGWQSWTATRELRANARVHGLERLPRAIVNGFVLDGSGDYRFVGYDARPGRFHGWTYAAICRGARHELVASTDETRGFTLVRMDAGAGEVALETEAPMRELGPGMPVELCSYVLLKGAEGEVYDRWFELSGVRARPVPALVGYSSWYRRYADIDEGALASDLAATRSALSALDLGSCAPVFQVDDGWCKVGDWLEPDPAKFPHGMEALAAQIGDESHGEAGFLPRISTSVKKSGDRTGQIGTESHENLPKPPLGEPRFSQKLKFLAENRPPRDSFEDSPVRKPARRAFIPGLWLAPFVCERDSRLFREHRDWLLRDESGRPVRTGSHWSGGFALDTRKPQVRAYVREVLRTVTRDWGFRFLKLDFLYAACMLPHDDMNRGELMADAIGLLREAAGDGVLVDGCGVPLASAFGKLDYCRVGCDVGLDWDGAPPLRLTDRERVSTRNAIADVVSRAPLDGRAFGCDPDVVILREGVRLTRRQKEMLLESASERGSMLLTSDDMGAWDAEQMAAFQRAVTELSARKENS